MLDFRKNRLAVMVLTICLVAFVIAIRPGEGQKLKSDSPEAVVHSSASSSESRAEKRVSMGSPGSRNTNESKKSEDTLSSREMEVKLSQFQNLSETVLKTEKQKDDYRNLLKDEAMIASASQFLMESHYDPKKDHLELVRIDRLNYLASALSWKENPARQQVVRAMEDLITELKIPKDIPHEAKKAMVGDQIEALMTLIEQAPESAQALDSKYREDPKLRKIILFAKNFYLQQRGK
jgi:hypothetical protein